MSDWSLPFVVLRAVWVTFRLYWDPAATLRLVAPELYFWHTVLVSLAYHSRDKGVVAYMNILGLARAGEGRFALLQHNKIGEDVYDFEQYHFMS